MSRKRCSIFVKAPNPIARLMSSISENPGSAFIHSISSAGCVLLAVPVMAQVAPADNQITKVIVGAKLEDYDARKDEVASRVVVSNAELMRYGDQTIAQALQRQPGVTVISSRGGSEIRLRGLGNGYTQILLNGQPAPGGFNLESLSPSLIEKIEIYRVPTAELSARAIAGSINIILKTRVSNAAREAKLSAEKSSRFTGRTATAQYSDKTGSGSFVLPLAWRKTTFDQDTEEEFSESPAGQGISRQYVSHLTGTGENETFTFTPRASIVDKSRTWGLQAYLNSTRANNANATRYAQRIGDSAVVPDSDNGRTRIANDQGRLEGTLTDKAVLSGQLDLKATFSAIHRKQRLTQELFSSANTALRETIQAYTEHGFSGSAKFARAIGKLRLSSGVEFSRSERDQDDIRRLTPTDVAARYSMNLASDITSSRYAAFAQGEFQMTPSLSLYTGARYERLVWEVRDNVAPEDFGAGIFSPILQALWKIPASTYQVRGAISRTYRPPGVGMLSRARALEVSNSAANPDNVGNPGLRPEIAEGVDLAVESFGKPGSMHSLSVYWKRINDQISQQLEYDGQRWFLIPENAGTARMFGAEAELRRRFPNALVAGDTLDFRVSAGINRSRSSQVVRHVAPIADQIPFTAAMVVDYRRSANTAFGLSIVRRAGISTWLTDDLHYAKSGATTFDLYAQRKFTPRVALRIGVSGPVRRAQDLEWNFDNGVLHQYRRLHYDEVPVVRANLDFSF